eukprot:CAMPEP_0168331252 /NCGR_PEP_ID=MMETSP0213-20121227/8220_1 /TAXON_ID=151035 /ORGANISM="Euplotes harpa, Strain FSP1.4" /LENGTH=68 /DNA_ID=CAMNT_0008334987 /DNA_START=245 /DNA_END=451 /DNA_ORIENTATION=+
MMRCASNCKSKIIEGYQMFKGVYTDKLTNDGYSLNEHNETEDMRSNKRMLNAMKDFEVHTATPSSNYV